MTESTLVAGTKVLMARRRVNDGFFGVGPTIAAVFLAVAVATAVLAPFIAPHNPLATDVAHRLTGPSASHLLGTDRAGRDVLSRTLYGGTSALSGMAVALGVMVAIGVPWGLLTGYVGGRLDQAGMRLADAFVSIPGLVFAVAITGALGPGLMQSMVAIGVVFAPTLAILLRSSVILIRHSDYVRVSGSLGTPSWLIAIRHVLPNAMGPALVQLCSLASLILILQAGLAFLGLGVQPPHPSWGADLADAYGYFVVAPLGTIVPGLTICVMAFAISRVGDGIRSILRTE